MTTHKNKDVSLGEVGEQHQREDDGKTNCDSNLRLSLYVSLLFQLDFKMPNM